MKSFRSFSAYIGFFFCCVSLLLVPACRTEGSASRSATGKLLQEARTYLSELKDQGKLPGYGRAQQGNVVVEAPWDRGKVSYPATVQVRAQKHGEPSTYRYALVKETKESSWRLVSAACFDGNGRKAYEWPFQSLP